MAGNALGSWYGKAGFNVRHGVYYLGGALPTVVLTKSGATAYEVRNYVGQVVSSGAVSGTTCVPTPPTGGWRPGWYRIYFTGPSSDATNGNAYSATMFTVIRDDPRFPSLPAGLTPTVYGNETADPIGKAVMGLGMSRHIIGSYSALTTGADTLAVCQAQAAVSRDWWAQPTHAAFADAARPRPLWCSTPGACADEITVAGSPSGTYLRVLVKDETVDGTQVWVASGSGTSSGTKITVFSPTSSTVAETYDNLGTSTAAATAINASSTLVKVFSGGATAGATSAATVIGRAVWNGVVQVVQALYPLGVTYYEYTNEPTLDALTAHRLKIFTGAVHAGHPSAKSMGPCPVSLNVTSWRTFLSAGGGANCDVISFHDYNAMTNGNLNLGRYSIEQFLAVLAEFGHEDKELWQTEAGAAFTGVYGVHHPRRARVKILHTLLWEQYGVPKERNPYWYDRSHGFWDFPVWWQHEDTSLTADAALHRVLSEEVFGKTHQQRLTFGEIADRILLGSTYGSASGSVVALIAASHMPGATATLSVTGASGSLTVVDAFGNETSAAITSGRVTVPVTDVPTYLRLPAGASATGYRFGDWPAVGSAQPSSGRRAKVTGTGAGAAGISNDVHMRSYSHAAWGYFGVGVARPATSMPDTVTLSWPTAARADRVVIWCGMAWQSGSSLLDFDVQTSPDGVTWTTQATVTKTDATSFLFGTNSENTWCTRETYWDEQWIYDVPFSGGPVAFRHLRLVVRSTSFGGEPDGDCLTAGGQGGYERIVVEELAVLCDDNTRRQIVVSPIE